MATAKTYSLNETPIGVPVFPSPVNNEFGWETTDYVNPAIPYTSSEVRNQIKLSEEQINNGQYITAREAIEHFCQLYYGVVDGEHIRVVTFWDMRQNPDNMRLFI